MAAKLIGILIDGKGVECPVCCGQCSIENEKGELKNCKECDAEGRLYPKEKDFEEIENREEYEITIQLIYNTLNRPMLPNEFLSQPAKFTESYRYLSPFLFGEFEKRKAEIDHNGCKTN